MIRFGAHFLVGFVPEIPELVGKFVAAQRDFVLTGFLALPTGFPVYGAEEDAAQWPDLEAPARHSGTCPELLIKFEGTFVLSVGVRRDSATSLRPSWTVIVFLISAWAEVTVCSSFLCK